MSEPEHEPRHDDGEPDADEDERIERPEPPEYLPPVAPAPDPRQA